MFKILYLSANIESSIWFYHLSAKAPESFFYSHVAPLACMYSRNGTGLYMNKNKTEFLYREIFQTKKNQSIN